MGVSLAAAVFAPALAVPIPEVLPKATMLYTVDEPWGVFAPGHLSEPDFHAAISRLLASDPIVREEDWLFDTTIDEETGEDVGYEVLGGLEHRYARLGEIHPELGQTTRPCKADDPGAFPITVIFY
jgi:hypothetical protein